MAISDHNDGVTILKEMDIEHPAGKMMVEIAKTQDTEGWRRNHNRSYPAGELLKNAENPPYSGRPSTVIAEGYQLAADRRS